jgi:hypothetical protein
MGLDLCIGHSHSVAARLRFCTVAMQRFLPILEHGVPRAKRTLRLHISSTFRRGAIVWGLARPDGHVPGRLFMGHCRGHSNRRVYGDCLPDRQRRIDRSMCASPGLAVAAVDRVATAAQRGNDCIRL